MEPDIAVTFERMVDRTLVVRVEVREPTLELLAEALRLSFESFVEARGCRRASYVNTEPRYVEVAETWDELRALPGVEAELVTPLERVDRITWIPKHKVEMYVAVMEYATEDGVTIQLARTTIVVDTRENVCWQHIDVGREAVKWVAREIQALLEESPQTS